MFHDKLHGLFSKALRSRHGATFLFIGLFVVVSFLIRAALFCRCANSVSWDLSLPAAFFVGGFFDLAMALFFAIPAACFFAAVPFRWRAKRLFRCAVHVFFVISIALFLYGGVAEWLFWSEFSVRFNFIAVDYLVYTHEVIQNIRESYNVPLIFAGLGAAAALFYGFFLRTGLLRRWFDAPAEVGECLSKRGLLFVLIPNAAALAAAIIVGASETGARNNFLEMVSQGLRHMSSVEMSTSNSFNTELAKNGEYALLAAFWSNELSYENFYPRLPEEKAYRRVCELLKQDNAEFVGGSPDDITRDIRGSGTQRRLNVIQITVESLSAEYLGCYGQRPYAVMGLTPNLDKLSRESLWFRNFYAGGTRTVRGMEALVLSVPPTPGQSVLRRPNNENLFTLGSVFQSAGYDTAFIYGGSGFFDNMNYFFANNGFRVVDAPAKIEADKPEIVFENAWGVCDEDLLDWVIAEADRAHATGKNFYHFVMTTSNHRPYTWPEGRIDIPSGIGSRTGAVKYTDYAIGRFLKEAEKHPWFKDTVFVVVADHTAGVAGKRELEVRKYEIPLFIYAPGFIKPRVVETLGSQIDFAPTLLGVLDWSYRSKFFGRDLLRASPTPARAFISNYQKIGLLEEDALAVLKPVCVADAFFCDRTTGSLSKKEEQNNIINDTIAYYQCASERLAAGKQKDFADSADNSRDADNVARDARVAARRP